VSNHFTGPGLQPAGGDPRLDVTDLYVFQAPGDPDRTVLIMDVNPFGLGSEFHPDGVYRINVDNDGDTETDVAFSVAFAAAGEGQVATVHLATGEQAQAREAGGEIIVANAPVSLGPEPAVVESGPYRFFAGVRSDPFFADFDGLLNEFRWTGNDTVGDKNVLAIVLEVPSGVLGSDPTIGAWARTGVRQDGRLIPVDRTGHPGVGNFFNPDEAKDEYNAGEPAHDRERYLDRFVEALEHGSGYSREDATAALEAEGILPDILRFDRSKPARYPNGRLLTDDVIDTRVAMLSHGQVTSDQLGPHTDLLSEFPYLGTPHPAPLEST
jgi:hypothetical protein